MISSPLIQDGRYGRHLGFGFHSFRGETPGSIDQISLWLIGGDYRGKFPPPLIQHGRYGSHLGFGFRRLSDERLRRLVQFFVAHWGVDNLHHIPLLPKHYLPYYTHRQLPTRGHMPNLA
jgi:hypothetical protein